MEELASLYFVYFYALRSTARRKQHGEHEVNDTLLKCCQFHWSGLFARWLLQLGYEERSIELICRAIDPDYNDREIVLSLFKV